MIRSLNTGVGGIRNFQTSLDVIANNLANLNTVGFKGGRVDFSEALTQTIRPSTPDPEGGNTSGSSSIQLSNGVNTNSVTTLFSQGAVNQTGKITDLALAGEGYFILKKGVAKKAGEGEGQTKEATDKDKEDSSSGGMLYATRAGDFRLDSNGYLVNNAGMRVQGISNYIEKPNEVGDVKFDRGDFMSSVDVIKGDKDNVIKTAKAHGFQTGNIVVFKADKMPGAVTEATPYYVRVISENEIALFSDLHQATTATANDLTTAVQFTKGEIENGMRVMKKLESFESVELVTRNEEQTITATNAHGFKDGDKVRFYITKGEVDGSSGPKLQGETAVLDNSYRKDAKTGNGYSRTYYVSLKGEKSFALHNSPEDAALRIRPVEFDQGSLSESAIVKVASSTTAKIQNISVDTTGRVNVMLTDGTQYTRGQVMLKKFTNEQALSKEGGNMYANLDNAGQSEWGSAGSDGFGIIESGALELSNVDVAREFSKLIATQRAFQANSRMVSASDEILMELLRLKR